MLEPEIFDEINAWVPEVIAVSLVRDIEAHMKAMIEAMYGNRELVTDEDIALRLLVLQRTRDKLKVLEGQLQRMRITRTDAAPEG